MSPDELLIMLQADAAAHAVEKFGAKLGAEHHLAVDVSALRVMYEISGAGAREVLAKGTPADVSPEALPEGVFCRSRVGQLQAAFWSAGDDAFRIICRRSEAEYLKDWLTAAAAPGTVPEYFNA